MASENQDYKKIEDLLFDGKNKAYGAYVLRQKTNRNLIFGISIGMMLVLSFYLVPFLINLFRPEADTEEIRQVEAEITPYSELVNPPPLPEETKLPEVLEEPPQVATKRFVKTELRPDEEIQEEDLMPTVQELKTANPGLETREGSGDIHAVYAPTKVVVDTAGKTPPKEQIYAFVERFPEFPGGEEALQRFIAENIVYPPSAMNVGIQGVVIVQFVVDSKGKIRNPEVVRDIGAGCGKAAVDVVMKMPNWSPGEQNGVAVSVRYTLPVRFKLVK
jgi:protein TonB